jgi:hypothetical protein
MLKREYIRHEVREEENQIIYESACELRVRHTVDKALWKPLLGDVIPIENEKRMLWDIYGDIVGPLHELRVLFLSRLPSEDAREANEIVNKILKATDTIIRGD